MNTPPESAPHLSLVEQAVPPQQYAEINLHGEPIDTITSRDGSEHQVLAWLELPADRYRYAEGEERPDWAKTLSDDRERPSTRVAICKPEKRTGKEKGEFVKLVEMYEDKETGQLDLRSTQNEYGWPRQPKHTNSNYAVAVLKGKRRDSNKLLVTFNSDDQKYRKNPVVIAAEGGLELKSGTSHDVTALITAQQRVQSRVEKAARWGKRTALAIGAYAIFASGGVLDHAGELANDAGQTVESTYGYDTPNPLTAGWIRPFNADVMNADLTKNHNDAVRRTVQTMEDLDSHNTDAILARAQQFEREHVSDILTRQQVQGFRDRIAHASTADEVMSVLNNFMQSFGKDAEFFHDTVTAQVGDGEGGDFHPYDQKANGVDDVRWLANKVVDALGYLPKEIVQGGTFKSIAFASHVPLEGRGINTGDQLVLPLRTTAERWLESGKNAAPDAIMQPADPVHGILHELGHSWDELLDYDQPTSNDWRTQLGFIVRKAVNAPKDISMYAATNPGREACAEEFATALDVVSDTGLAHPDEWRRFNSLANKKALAVAIEFDSRLPGFIDYLAAQRLVHRNAIQTPLIPFVS